MFKRIITYAKDFGFVGELVSFVVSGLIGLALPYCRTYLPFLSKTISLAVPIYIPLAFFLVFATGGVMTRRFFGSATRMHSKLFGFYRRNCDIAYFPYLKDNNGQLYTQVTRTMEFVVTRKDITSIGPYFYYSYEPRGSGGMDALINVNCSCKLNGEPNKVFCDAEFVRPDKLKVVLRPQAPLKVGAQLLFEMKYNIIGQNACCQEELDDYFNNPNTKETSKTRKKVMQKMRAEMVYGFLRQAAHYKVSVNFPETFPWRLHDNIEETVLLSAGTRPIDKKEMDKLVKLSVTSSSIVASLPLGVSTDHGYYIFWKLPSRAQLASSGVGKDDSSNPITKNIIAEQIAQPDRE